MGRKVLSFDPGTVLMVTDSVENLVDSLDDSFDSMSSDEVEDVQRKMFIAARDLQERAVRLYSVIRIKKSERRLKEAKDQLGTAKEGSDDRGKGQ